MGTGVKRWLTWRLTELTSLGMAKPGGLRGRTAPRPNAERTEKRTVAAPVLSTDARRPSSPARSGPTHRDEFVSKRFLLRTSRPGLLCTDVVARVNFQMDGRVTRMASATGADTIRRRLHEELKTILAPGPFRPSHGNTMNLHCGDPLPPSERRRPPRGRRTDVRIMDRKGLVTRLARRRMAFRRPQKSRPLAARDRSI